MPLKFTRYVCLLFSLGAQVHIAASEDSKISGDVLFFQDTNRTPLKISGQIKGLPTGFHEISVYENLDIRISGSGYPDNRVTRCGYFIAKFWLFWNQIGI